MTSGAQNLTDEIDPSRVWRWRNQYGEVLGGLGTGIGEGDRGVTCGREEACAGAKECEQETDCDAEDARDSSTTPWMNLGASLGPTAGSASGAAGAGAAMAASPAGVGIGSGNGNGGGGQSGGTAAAAADGTSSDDEQHLRVGGPGEQLQARTPSPQLGPGYERHEIEGIGGVVKKKLVRMVRVGACVPEVSSFPTVILEAPSFPDILREPAGSAVIKG